MREASQVDLVELSDFNIGFYEYEIKNKDDDFYALFKTVLLNNQIILATPVYWYAMSAQLIFFLTVLQICFKAIIKS